MGAMSHYELQGMRMGIVTEASNLALERTVALGVATLVQKFFDCWTRSLSCFCKSGLLLRIELHPVSSLRLPCALVEVWF